MTAPRDPEAVILLGTFYQQLGGAFTIDSSGQRRMSCRIGADPDELRVRIMLEAMIERLPPADKDYLFAAFAECEDAGAGFSEPTRGADQ